MSPGTRVPARCPRPVFSDHTVAMLLPFWGHAAWEGGGGGGGVACLTTRRVLRNEGRREELPFIQAQAATGGNCLSSAGGMANQIQRPLLRVLCSF